MHEPGAKTWAGARIAMMAALLCAPLPAWAGFTVPANRPGAFAPRDECSGIGGAREFIVAVRGAIAGRDAEALATLATEDVLLDFGGGAGREELRTRLSGAQGPELWHELDAATGLGCAYVDDELVQPWLFAQDLGDVDPYDALVAAGPAVPIYAGNKARGHRAGWLNWQLVIPLVLPPAPAGYRRVSVINVRREGLVQADQLRSVIGYRLVAARQGGAWRIRAFVAGD